MITINGRLYSKLDILRHTLKDLHIVQFVAHVNGKRIDNVYKLIHHLDRDDDIEIKQHERPL